MSSAPRLLPDVTLVGIDCVDAGRLLGIAALCQRKFQFADVKLFSSTVPPGAQAALTRLPELRSKEEYSRFVVKELSHHIRTSHLLIVQHDGFILNPEAWDDRFLAYDYIGAPWEFLDGGNVGNGGFSLRSKRLMDALRDDHISQVHPEDQIICRTYRKYLRAKGMVFAPEDLAGRFSLEGNSRWGYAWQGQFGFHSYYSTDLTNWNVFQYANLPDDSQFIARHVAQLAAQAKINKLLLRLSDGNREHAVDAVVCADRPREDFLESIERGNIVVRFPSFRRPLEIRVKLERGSCDLSTADLVRKRGSIWICGTLDWEWIRLLAEIDVSTLKGVGRLVPRI